MKLLNRSSFVALALACATALPAAQPAPASAAVPVEPDWLAVVGLYPGLGTGEGQGELAVLTWLQQVRTPDQVSQAVAESHLTFGCWADVLTSTHALGSNRGGGIELADFPMTEALLVQAQQDLQPVLTSLQAIYARPRPYVADPRLTPALPADPSLSYPSTHATVGALYAQIIAQFQGSNRAAIEARGNQLGNDRVTVGLHYPSDVTAGQRLGKAFASYWIDQPGNSQLIKAACAAEWYKN